jgi:tetratricopeptide (TPR) repeat protein
MRALGRSATRAAVEHLARAVTALDRAKREPELVARAIDVRLDLRYALTILGQYERALPHLRQAEALAAELDDTPRLARVVSFLANGLYLLGDHAGAIASAGRATEIAQRLNDFATRVTANIYAGRALHALGRYREATETFGLVIDMLGGAPATERAGLPVLPAAYARSYRAMGFIELGDFDAALATVGDAMALAEASEHLDTIQWACYALGLALLDRGDAEAALAPLERALSICRAAELPVYVPRAAAALGHARVMAGRADGVALIESAAADGEAASQRNQQARFLARLAEVYSLTGRAKDAADRAARSLALAREHGERGTEAHALWALAVAAEMEPRAGDARRLLEASLTLATELGMEPLAARGRLRLGRLARLAGHQEEAAAHLAAAHRALARLQMTSWKRETAAELALLG